MSARPALEAVLFDAGGTLVRLDYEWIAGMLAELGVRTDPVKLRRCEIQGRRALDRAAAFEAGAGGPLPDRSALPAPVRAYFVAMLEAAGCPAGRLDEARSRLEARQASDHFLWARPMEGARGALDSILALGLRAACVSNSDGRAEAHLERFGLRQGLEFVVDSHRVGVEKPDPRIFQIALERMGVLAARSLYVGDIRAGDEAGARAAGMHFVLLDPFGDYAPRGVDAIPAIERLPRYVSEHFDVRGSRPVPRGTAAARDAT